MYIGLGNLLTRGGFVSVYPNNYSFNFDGSNDYLDCGDINAIDGASQLTMSAWMKRLASDDIVVVEKSTDNNDRVGLHLGSDGNIYYIISTGSGLAYGSVALAGTDWHHVVGVFDGSLSGNANRLKIYVGGALQTLSFSGTIPSTTPSSSASLLIGKDVPNTQYSTGNIDEVAVWSVALSADDIAKIASKPLNLSKASTYDTDRTSNLKLWLRAGDKVLPEEDTSIARSDFYTAFDGSSEYVDCGNDSSLQLASDMTITGWINPTGTTSSRALVFKRDSGGTNYQLAMDTSTPPKLRFYDGTTATSSSGSLTKDRWQHIAITIDSGVTDGSIFYIDGVASGTATFTISGDDADLLIGKHATDSPVTYYEGDISSVSIYQTALDSQTIKALSKSRFLPQRQAMFSVVDFDGTNPYIVTSGNVGISGSSARTLGLWFNPTATNQYYELIEWGGTGSANATCGLYLYSSKIFFYGWGAGDFDTGVAPLSTWQHLYATYDGTTVKVYLNGVLIGSSSESLNTSDTVLKIGNSTSNEFSGSISSVSIYDVAKTEQEIYALYQKGITYDESSENGLHAYYRMGDDTSKAYPTIADSSSNSNDGTITNGASDDIVQQMVAGYDMGAFESTGEEVDGNVIVNGDFASGSLSSWNAVSGGNAMSVVNNSLVHAVGTSGGVRQSVTLTSGALYKGSFDILEITEGNNGNTTTPFTIYNYAGSSVKVASTEYGIQTNTFYFVPDDNGIWFEWGTGDGFTIDNFTLKEVLQSADLSDTYPAIIDVNEPVLGVNLVDANTNSSWTAWGSNTIGNVTGGVSVTYDDNVKGAIGYLTDAKLLSTDLTNGKTYKLTFNAYYSGGSAGSYMRIIDVTPAKNFDALTTTSTAYTHYFVMGSSSPYLQMGSMGASNVVYITDVIVKEVQGNPGTMTSMATDNLTYSSVLPDQSYLATGNSSPYNFIDFDGTDQYIDCGSDSSLKITGKKISVSAWVNASTLVHWGGIGHNASGGSWTNGWTLSWRSGNTFRFTINQYDTNYAYASFSATNSWHHVVGVYDGTLSSDNIKIYIDGDVGTSANYTSDLGASGNTFIGKSVDGKWNGYIGQTAIWNKALSSSDVSSIYNLGKNTNLLDSYSDNCVGLWAMSALDASTGLSDSISTIYDRSGNSNHGTPQNADAGDLKSSPNADPNGYSKGETNRSTDVK